MLHLHPNLMVVVAQLVRAPDCGSGGRRFETGLPPDPSPQFLLGVSSFIEAPVRSGIV